jgi:hypothetical protein
MEFNHSEVFEKLLEPIDGMCQNNAYSRSCPRLEDESWIKVGLQRSLAELCTGRGFLIKLIIDGADYLSCSHYFESLKSERRLNHLLEVHKQLIIKEESTPDKSDPFLKFPELASFDLYAGDGHYHEAPVHEIKVDNKVFATQHFYALNLRSYMMSHLTLAEYGGDRKKEHDMRALKRMTIAELRKGAKKGQKVLYVWDKAGIDFKQWQKWKQQGGVYFLSEEKASNRLLVCGEPAFDTEDPVNAGVLNYESVASANGISFSRVTYQCPETGNIFKFLTNLPKTIRPGVIAQLYRSRWDIERKYNVFKNKLFERKAWATTSTAKNMQAIFLCLAHNLTHIFGKAIESEVDVSKDDVEKQEARSKESKKKAQAAGREAAPHVFGPKRVTELPRKLFIWLRSWIFKVSPWKQAMENLKGLFRDKNHSKRGDWHAPDSSRGGLIEKI